MKIYNVVLAMKKYKIVKAVNGIIQHLTTCVIIVMKAIISINYLDNA